MHSRTLPLALKPQIRRAILVWRRPLRTAFTLSKGGRAGEAVGGADSYKIDGETEGER